MVFSEAREGLKPESGKKGEFAGTEECAHSSPELWRSLRQKGSVGSGGGEGEHMARNVRSLKAIWRDGDREDGFLV